MWVAFQRLIPCGPRGLPLDRPRTRRTNRVSSRVSAQGREPAIRAEKERKLYVAVRPSAPTLGFRPGPGLLTSPFGGGVGVTCAGHFDSQTHSYPFPLSHPPSSRFLGLDDLGCGPLLRNSANTAPSPSLRSSAPSPTLLHLILPCALTYLTPR